MRKLTTDEYRSKLRALGRPFEVVEEYVTCHTPIKHRCSQGHTFNAMPLNVSRKGKNYNCPRCIGHSSAFLADDYYDLLASTVKTIRNLEPYVSANTEIWHQCDCGHKWKVRPNNIQAGKGCPRCAFQNDAFYIWENLDDPGVYKGGVTSLRQKQNRIKQCAKNNGMRQSLIMHVHADNALAIESEFKKLGKNPGYSEKLDGHTEFRILTDEELGQAVKIAYDMALAA